MMTLFLIVLIGGAFAIAVLASDALSVRPNRTEAKTPKRPARGASE